MAALCDHGRVTIWYRSAQPVRDGYAAKEQGIQSGDVITEVNGEKVHLWDEVSLYNLTNQKGEATEITYLRDGKETTVTLAPRQS